MTDINAARLGADAAHRLRQSECCTTQAGLSDDDFDRIEATYGFRFSDDHRAFPSAGLPVSSPPEEGATWDNPLAQLAHRQPRGPPLPISRGRRTGC